MNMMINSHVHLTQFIELEENKLIERIDYYKTDLDSKNSLMINNLSFKYFNSDEYIFENLNLNIEKSKHTVITGPNGSGKSTLLGLISRVFYPENGTISVHSNKIGYVGVTPLILEASLRDNFLYGNTSNIDDAVLEQYMDQFELFNSTEKQLDTIVSNKTLSSGQMQKIAFIRSLIANCEILLLDESTSNLDVETKNLIFNILSEKKITIINSTHNHEDFNYDFHINIKYKGEKRYLEYV
jgi:ABC-type multidrug transport system fused ATPase/permease subunit